MRFFITKTETKRVIGSNQSRDQIAAKMKTDKWLENPEALNPNPNLSCSKNNVETKMASILIKGYQDKNF